MRRLFVIAFGNLLLLAAAPAAETTTTPSVTLRAAETVTLPGGVDSNSPVFWDRRYGRSELFVLTSINGRPSRSTGGYLTTLSHAEPVDIEPWPTGGNWMEAIVRDTRAWYGFYHNENEAIGCGQNLNYPKIGAARSDDFGKTWTDLGIILDLPRETFACDTRNRYFAGGAGDMSVVLDRGVRDLYIYFSQYSRSAAQQGVAVARLAWADRDAPVGKLAVWSGGVWLPGRHVDEDGGVRWVYPPATPLVEPARPWHDADPVVDAFWGPSIHWNSYLQRYVMLLNRAADENWTQEGIYISYNASLGDPAGWTPPQKIVNGGRWYPQVAGVEPGRGGDAWAGRIARFFMSGRSDHTIEFTQ